MSLRFRQTITLIVCFLFSFIYYSGWSLTATNENGDKYCFYFIPGSVEEFFNNDNSLR